MITKPGVYTMPAAAYHEDPVENGSLSHTGAVMLLPPSCPAKYFHRQCNPEPPSEVFDVGKAAHELVLRGVNAVTVIDHDSWRTKAAQAAKTLAYAQGKIPLLTAQWQRVEDMAAALYEHKAAAALLRGGKPEQALVWRDSGIWRRALLDFLPDRDTDSMYGVEYKTCLSAHPDAISRALWERRYCQQGPYYQDGMHSLGLTGERDVPFYFIMQEKEPPYIVTIAQMKPDAIKWGRVLNAKAIEVYKRCVATGRWGGYTDDVVGVSLPTYAEYQLDAMMESEVSA